MEINKENLQELLAQLGYLFENLLHEYETETNATADQGGYSITHDPNGSEFKEVMSLEAEYKNRFLDEVEDLFGEAIERGKGYEQD